VSILAGLSLVIGGMVFFLWYQGIFFGAPRDATKALAKMVTALQKTPAYHTEGQAVVKIGPPGVSTTTTQTSLVPALLRAISVSAEELSPIDDSKCGVPGTKCVTPPEGNLGGVTCQEARAVCAEADVSSLPVIPDVPVEITLSFEGDRVNETTSQIRLNFDLSGLLTLLPPTIPPSIDLDVRRVGGDVYLRLPILALLVGSESNKWLALSERDLESVGSESLNFTTIKATVLQQAIRSGERIGYESIGPVRAVHYRLSIDPLTFMGALQFKQSFDDGLTNALRNVSLTADLWLGSRNFLPYQYVLTAKYLDESLGFDSQLLLKAQLSNFGQTMAITAPSENEVLRDGLQGLLTGDLTNFEKKARDTQRKSDLSEIKTALELYKGDHGAYLSTGGAITRSNEANGVLQELVKKGYLSSLPIDPVDPTNWYGYQSGNGSSYELWSIIEDENDPTAIDRGPYRIYRVFNDLTVHGNSNPISSLSPLATPTVSPAAGSGRLPGTS
jgi:hypothetical protein